MGWKSQTIFQKRRQVLFGLGISLVYSLFAAIAFRGLAVAVLSLNIVVVIFSVTRAYLVGRKIVAQDVEVDEVVADPVPPIVLEQPARTEIASGKRLNDVERQRLERLLPRPRALVSDHIAFVPADRQREREDARRRRRLRAS